MTNSNLSMFVRTDTGVIEGNQVMTTRIEMPSECHFVYLFRKTYHHHLASHLGLDDFIQSGDSFQKSSGDQGLILWISPHTAFALINRAGECTSS